MRPLYAMARMLVSVPVLAAMTLSIEQLLAWEHLLTQEERAVRMMVREFVKDRLLP